jgi:hypothetical protein
MDDSARILEESNEQSWREYEERERRLQEEMGLQCAMGYWGCN